MKEWLQAERPAIAVAFAARAALRVLPFVQRERSEELARRIAFILGQAAREKAALIKDAGNGGN